MSFRVALVGAGGFASHAILPALAMTAGVEIMSIYDLDRRSAINAAKQYGISNVAASLEELLGQSNLDLVWVATPSIAHMETLEAVIDAGCNFVCEKPVSLSAEQTRKLLSKAEAAGVVHVVDHEWRYLPLYATIRKLIAEGYIGDPRLISLAINTSYSLDPRYIPTYFHGFGSMLKQGGGVLPQLLSHFIDLFEFMFGGIQAQGGHCTITIPEKPTLKQPGKLFEKISAEYVGEMKPVDAEDTVALSGCLNNGAAVSIAASWAVPQVEPVRWSISGSEGVLISMSRLELSDGDLMGVQGRNGQIETLPMITTAASRGNSAQLDYTSYLLSAEIEDIIQSIREPGREGSFATLASELQVWKNIELWRKGLS